MKDETVELQVWFFIALHLFLYFHLGDVAVVHCLLKKNVACPSLQPFQG